MDLELEIEFSKAPILQEVDDLKKQIDDLRPLPADVEGRVMQKLRLDWNYNSNAIEGNKLSYGETTALLMHGITAKGKPLKDHLDIKGHNKAVEYLESIIKDDRAFTQMDIRGLHEVILGEGYRSPAQTAEGTATYKHIKVGQYKSLPNHVETITGEIHYYASPEETPAKMNDLMDWFHSASDGGIHPVVIAALYHHRFVAIHPFDDGNGRMARIIMNLILMQNGYPPVIIRKNDKQNYYSLLSQADAGEDQPFIEYISERLQSSLELYVKAMRGDDIEEDEDIDKEIALLKMQLNAGVTVKEKKSYDALKRVFSDSIYPLAVKLLQKTSSFYEFFFTNKAYININYSAYGRTQYLQFDINEVDRNKERIYNSLSESDVNLNLQFVFSEYKDTNNIFTISTMCFITFDDYYYHISINGEQAISKLYHEELLQGDFSKVIKLFIIDFKQNIDVKLKSPKS